MDDFTIWTTLVHAAVVGTDRSALPPPLLEQLAGKGLDVYGSAEEALLSAAALTRLRIKAGRVFPEWKTALPEPAFFQAGVIHSQASRFLSILLSGRYVPAFGEWLQLFTQRKLSLPPESLPGLLNRCVEDESVREALEPWLGELAQWLISQNPAWAILGLREDPEIWHSGSRTERMAYLSQLRKKDPAAARTLLEETWETESTEDKVAFQEILGLGLSISDEPLLRRGQSDRRQEVRHTAGKLLAQIPGSAINGQLLALADRIVQFDGKRVRLAPPPEWPDWLHENGLVKKGKDPDPEERLQAVLEWIPPAHWSKTWDLAGEMIVEYLLSWPDLLPLKKALILATIRYRDAGWAEAILEYQTMGLEDQEIKVPQYEQMTGLLSAETFQNLIARAWEEAAEDLSEFGPAENLLRYSTHPWEASFAREWLGQFQALLITSGESWDLWSYHEFLRHAAYRVPPLPEAPWLGGWDQLSPRTGFLWKEDIDYFLRVVRFRIDMQEAFK